jgi:hypothetical protein
MQFKEAFGFECVCDDAYLSWIRPCSPSKEQDAEQEILEGVGGIFFQQYTSFAEQAMSFAPTIVSFSQFLCKCGVIV